MIGIAGYYLQTEVVAARLGNTLLLGGLGFLLLTVLSAAVGLVCAWQEGRFLDRLLCKVGTIVSCVPEFWLSLALILLFSVTLHWLPASGAYSAYGGGVGDRLAHLILPLFVCGYFLVTVNYTIKCNT